MDKPIQVGDLVQVVRWPCCGWRIGAIGVVTDFCSGQDTNGRCGGCESHIGKHFSAAKMPYWVPLPWLKRIPPLEELDDVKQDEEITA